MRKEKKINSQLHLERACAHVRTSVSAHARNSRRFALVECFHVAFCISRKSTELILADFYRASYASAVLGVVILSVCPSVCHTRAFWLIQRTYRWYFYTTWKGNPSSQMWFFVQLCSSWQDFNWLKGSRGPSAAAELLVVFVIVDLHHVWFVEWIFYQHKCRRLVFEKLWN